MRMNNTLPAGYQFVTDYADNAELCASLNHLTEAQWGIRVLNQGDEDYRPFSILYKNQIVANVCVGRFNLVINGQALPANMIQTVLTHPDHRKKGLVRALFEPVQSFIASDTGRTFFPANKDKKAFYGKFGYTTSAFAEGFVVELDGDMAQLPGIEKVNYLLTSERDELELAAANRTSVSNVFGYEHRNWLFFWYCDNFHNEKIYKIDDLGCYILFEVKDDELIVLDIVAEKIPKLAAVLPYLLNTSEQAVRKVRFMFCPDKLTDQYYAIDNTEDLFYSCDQFRLPDRVFCIPETLRG